MMSQCSPSSARSLAEERGKKVSSAEVALDDPALEDMIGEKKAAALYAEIDRNALFTGTAEKCDRSIMNVCFVMKPEYKELEKDFIDFASTKGIVGIKGHRSVGGFRASLYNAMPMSSVQVLIDAMKEFENNH